MQSTVGEIGAFCSQQIVSQQKAESLDPSSDHQFTNPSVESPAKTELEPVGDPTNSSPIAPIAFFPLAQQSPTATELAAKILLCQNWVGRVETTPQDAEATTEASPALTKAEQPTGPVVLQCGQRVRVVLPGSQRDGKTGVVERAISEGGEIKYEVWLNDASIRRDLRKMVCCSGWLEALASDAGDLSG